MSEPSFGRYEPLFRIAAGGMAEVYAARIRGEAGFEKLVAIKRMHPHLADDAEFVTMFLDEGRLAANVVSPHVVSTIDLGRADDGALFLVMELVVGAPLSTLLKSASRSRRLLPVPIACEILAQAAAGLDDAHEARTPTGVHLGIVHRDVSPQNVLVGIDGRTRVVDFGIARATRRQTQTSTGTLKGKYAYFSPEQAARADVDRRSDVFSLGVVAWETLLAKRLFDPADPVAQLTQVRTMTIPPPSSLRPDVPAAVSDVVMRALERDPARRWASAAAFGTALRRASRTEVSAREIAAIVDDLGGEVVTEMRARIERALGAGGASRGPIASAPAELLPTPSDLPMNVADLPTMVRAPAAVQATPAPTERARRSSASVWIAVAVVIALSFAAYAATRQATPAPATVVATPAPSVVASPPETVLPAPAPAPPSTVTVTVAAPAPDATEVDAPPETHAPARPTEAPPHETHASETPPAPAPSAAPTKIRRPAGLADDDAFDHGL